MIVFVSNFMNHHQSGVAKELFKLTNGNYRFIELEQMPESFRKAGYPDLSNEPFVIKAWKSEEDFSTAKNLINDAEVVVFGGTQRRELLQERINDNKLTFEYGERWLKRGLLNILSPNFIKALRQYKNIYKDKVYYLCAGAFVKKDLNKFGVFENRCFKYGYFPEVAFNESIERNNKTVKLISVARLIDWKRIDLAIEASKILKEKEIQFEHNIYGDGPLKSKLQELINNYKLENHVFLKGNLQNKDILQEMQKSDIFVFPSNQREGWGAVLNEAMASGCAVVASDRIGSVPFLIKDGITGLTFKEGDKRELAEKIKLLIENKNLRIQLGKNAIDYLKNEWNPQKVAVNLLSLIDGLLSGVSDSVKEGPCSKA